MHITSVNCNETQTNVQLIFLNISDCGSPTFEYPHVVGCNGSRSNSPADSETSGISSMDGSLSDIMVILLSLSLFSSFLFFLKNWKYFHFFQLQSLCIV